MIKNLPSSMQIYLESISLISTCYIKDHNHPKRIQMVFGTSFYFLNTLGHVVFANLCFDCVGILYDDFRRYLLGIGLVYSFLRCRLS